MNCRPNLQRKIFGLNKNLNEYLGTKVHELFNENKCFFLHKNYINLHGLGFVEWLNNYQHSLVRRALVGEINYRFSTFFNINLLKVTFATQIFFVFVFYYFSTKFFLNFNQKSFLKILAIFSPIGFLFPVGEVEALGRQEIIFLAL